MAFGKLQGVLDSKPLALPGKNYINWWVRLWFSVCCLFVGLFVCLFVCLRLGHVPSTPPTLHHPPQPAPNRSRPRGLFAGILTAAGVFATGHDPATAVGALVATAAVGGVLGAHLTASIGARGRAHKQGGSGEGSNHACVTP